MEVPTEYRCEYCENEYDKLCSICQKKFCEEHYEKRFTDYKNNKMTFPTCNQCVLLFAMGNAGMGADNILPLVGKNLKTQYAYR